MVRAKAVQEELGAVQESSDGQKGKVLCFSFLNVSYVIAMLGGLGWVCVPSHHASQVATSWYVLATPKLIWLSPH